MIDSLETVFYSLNYIIPGYITLKIIEKAVPHSKYTDSEMILKSFGYSILSYSLRSIAFQIIELVFSKQIILVEFLNFLALILSGTIMGIAIAAIQKNNLIGKLLLIFKIETTNICPTAWDYVFSKYESYWVEIGVSNDKVIRGLYSNNSLASNEPSEKDIYLEKLYEKAGGGWKEVEQTKGIWINHNEIRYIKFYQLEGDNDGKQ